MLNKNGNSANTFLSILILIDEFTCFKRKVQLFTIQNDVELIKRGFNIHFRENKRPFDISKDLFHAKVRADFRLLNTIIFF